MKLNAIMEEVDRIAKRGRNTVQNYDYLMAEDVINDVRQELVKQKVLVIAGCTNVVVLDGVTKSGGATYLTTASMEYTIIDCETGERLVFPWAAQGQDSGDKGIYKAQTGSHKTFLRNLLMIPVGDDPEKENHERVPKGAQKPPTPPPPAVAPPTTATTTEKTINEAQVKRLYTVATANGWSHEQVKATLAHSKGKYASAKDIKPDAYDAVVGFFEKNKPPAPKPEDLT